VKQRPVLTRLFAGLLLLVGLGLAGEQLARWQVRRTLPLPGRWVRVGDHRLHLRTYGTGGPVVVFESGLDTGGSLVWERVARQVAPFATAVTYDRAGLLGSERGTGPKTGAAMAQDLHALLHHAGYAGPYLLVGHSLAGVTLRAFITQYPHEVGGLVLVDASHPDQEQRFPAAHHSSPPPPLWAVRVASGLGLVRLFSQEVYPGTQPTDTVNLLNNAYLPTSLPAAVEEQQQWSFLMAEARRVTSFGHLPLIVLTGTSPTRYSEYADKALRQQVTQTWGELQHELLRLSSQSTQQLGPKSAHYIQLQQPDLVTAAIKQLLVLPEGVH
jgi:pimeloyl-ACP methyl ester carboxylesterase